MAGSWCCRTSHVGTRVCCPGSSAQVPPCDNGGELRRLITAGGGKVAEKSSKDVINLPFDWHRYHTNVRSCERMSAFRRQKWQKAVLFLTSTWFEHTAAPLSSRDLRLASFTTSWSIFSYKLDEQKWYCVKAILLSKLYVTRSWPSIELVEKK